MFRRAIASRLRRRGRRRPRPRETARGVSKRLFERNSQGRRATSVKLAGAALANAVFFFEQAELRHADSVNGPYRTRYVGGNARNPAMAKRKRPGTDAGMAPRLGGARSASRFALTPHNDRPNIATVIGCSIEVPVDGCGEGVSTALPARRCTLRSAHSVGTGLRSGFIAARTCVRGSPCPAPMNCCP